MTKYIQLTVIVHDNAGNEIGETIIYFNKDIISSFNWNSVLKITILKCYESDYLYHIKETPEQIIDLIK